MKTKRIIALLLSIGVISSLTGCNKDDNQDPLMNESKETLVAMINEASIKEVQYIQAQEELTAQIASLEERIRGSVTSESVSSGIGEIAAGIEQTFITIDQKLVFPVEFNYPGSVQSPNTSSVSISEAVKIHPTSNWVIKMTGSKVEVSHTSGISGIFSVGTLSREAQRQSINLQEYLVENFFSELPPEHIKFSSLHIDDTKFGVDAVSATTIDEEPGMIRCGMVGYGEISLQYFFVYKGERDSAKDETILSMMRTIKIWDKELSVIE